MRVLPPPEGRMSVSSALRVVHLLDDRARIFLVDVDHDRLVRLGPCCRSRLRGTARADALMPSSKPSRRIVSISTPS